MYPYCFSSAGRGNGRGAMPFLMSFTLEHEIVTLAWVDNASVQFPLNIYATEGYTDTVKSPSIKVECEMKAENLISGGGHLSPLEGSNKVAEVISDFLAEQQRPANEEGRT